MKFLSKYVKVYYVALYGGVVLLSGCSATKEPLIQQTMDREGAKVRFILDRESGALNIYPEDNCNDGAMIVAKGPLREAFDKISGNVPKRIGMIDEKYSPSDFSVAEYSFKANQILNLGAQSIGQCIKGLSMRLESGAQYEIKLDSMCLLTAVQLRKVDEKIYREKVSQLQPLICDGKWKNSK